MNTAEPTNSIVIYQTSDGQTSIDVKLQNDTVWLSQAQMAELFQKDRTVIGRHINNIFKEGELERETTCANFAHMGSDGDQQYVTTLYNLYDELSQLVKVLGRTIQNQEKLTEDSRSLLNVVVDLIAPARTKCEQATA